MTHWKRTLEIQITIEISNVEQSLIEYYQFVDTKPSIHHRRRPPCPWSSCREKQIGVVTNNCLVPLLGNWASRRTSYPIFLPHHLRPWWNSKVSYRPLRKFTWYNDIIIFHTLRCMIYIVDTTTESRILFRFIGMEQLTWYRISLEEIRILVQDQRCYFSHGLKWNLCQFLFEIWNYQRKKRHEAVSLRIKLMLDDKTIYFSSIYL